MELKEIAKNVMIKCMAVKPGEDVLVLTDDSRRKIDPLKKADDAEEVDTTFMSIEQVRDHLLDRIRSSSL